MYQTSIMISFPSAIKIISEETLQGKPIQLPTNKALGYILSKEITSPINMPPFNQSAMDGYALGDIESESYKVIHEIKAGDSSSHIQLNKGEAARIFTGGMAPEGTIAIAKQEIVDRKEAIIQLTEKVALNANIRPLGEQINKGDLALNKNKILNAGTVGYLYGIGVDSVTVFSKPKVVIIATGNELTKPGEKLDSGKIYESNTYTLKAALEEINIDAEIQTVKDDYQSTVNTIQKALESFDIVILTGGISVGDYDFVGKAFNELNVVEKFYKVKQKPGKPIYFGKKDSTAVYGLPGNPAAALSCFYLYVIPAVRKYQGFEKIHLEKRILKLKTNYNKSVKMSHFLKAFYTSNEVEILNSQSSAMLSSFATANCIAILEEGRESWAKGDEIEVYILP